jgi:hypothetical protein
MKYSTTAVLSAALTLSSFVAAEDVLYSKRNLNKRFNDAQGNYNICKISQRFLRIELTCFQLSTTLMTSMHTWTNSAPVELTVPALLKAASEATPE